ncbi:MAG: DUF1800 domain-containing protein [Henriciella sp.]|nr:DUF1800 domain-containing protein [Henriciella sp.]
MRKSANYLVSIVFAAGLVLAACGGGGGGSSVPPTAPPVSGGGSSGSGTGGTGSGGSGSGTGGGSSGGGTTGTGAIPPAASSNVIADAADASRFLARASFGGSKPEIASLTGTDAANWVANEFAKPVTLTMPTLLAQPRTSSGELEGKVINALYWDHMIGSNDQLRQRMAFALSQILVYSDVNDPDQIVRAHYQDTLIQNAFGNYRDVLEAVTYTAAMGNYLTYRGNRRGDPNTGRMPDENYAREIMQLFSIGVVELNMDGTPRLDAQGQQIETYTNDDVIGLAKVFTGLDFAQSGGGATSDARIRPMEMIEDRHSPLEKQFLGTTIPAGTRGNESIRRALDTIFAHPNVAPFISRQLIQRFTHSDPSTAYVQSVATAFENGRFVSLGGQQFGTGQRGDLQATLAAILLEPTLFSDPTSNTDFAFGKVREPILRFTHWARAFNVQGLNAKNENDLRDTRSNALSLGQQAYRAPSVFNFYRPGYVAPGTIAGDRGITVPEFQTVNASSAVGIMNFLTDFVFDRASQVDNSIQTYDPDYSTEINLADTPQALVDHLDDLLTGGRMSDVEKTDIVDIIGSLEIRTDTPQNTAADREDVVRAAVALILNSPSYAVTW